MARAGLASSLRSGFALRPAVVAPRSLALPVPVELTLLALISGAALALRLWQLGDWSLWIDEIFSLRAAANLGFSTGRLSIGLIDLLVSQLGVTEWSARLGPALVGAFTIPLLYLPTRRLLGAPAAMLSSLLLAISPWHIFWSQNARFYTVLLLYYTLGLLVFYAGLERDRPWYFAIFLALVVLAYKERLFGLFMVPAALGYVLLLKVLPWSKPAGLRWFTPASIAISLAMIGVLFFRMMWPLDVFFADFWGQTLDAQRPLASALALAIDIPYRVSFPLFAVAVFGAYRLTKVRQRTGLFLSLSAGVPMLALVILAPFSRVDSRYAFMALGFWTMLGAAGLVQLLSHAGRRPSKLAYALVCGLFLLGALDPGLRDAAYYYLGLRGTAGQALLLALAFGLAAAGLLVAGKLLRPRAGWPSRRNATASSRSAGELLLSLAILLAVMARLALAGSLYFGHQHGGRADWKAAMTYVDEHRLAGDVIATGSQTYQDAALPEATYYAGAGVLVHDSQEMKSALAQGRRAWIITTGTERAPSALAPWARPVCGLAHGQDRFQDGGLEMTLVFLCNPAGKP